MTGIIRNSSFPLWPSFTNEMVEASARVLRSGKVNYWTGNEGKQFEQDFARWVGVNHAVAMANGTVALEAALYAIGIKSGDEVVVTPRTFVASASAIVRMGAVPVFADVERDSGNITDEGVTVMISNIPCKVNDHFLTKAINSVGFGDKFSFVNLPRNKHGKNLGYCFVHFHTSEDAVLFALVFEHFQFPGRTSPKMCTVKIADLQGESYRCLKSRSRKHAHASTE